MLNLHSPMFPALSVARYRTVCSPAKNFSPGPFRGCVTLGINPELSVALGGDHMTVADMVPRSAITILSGGQFVKVGPKTS